jgi:hypothetical protein
MGIHLLYYIHGNNRMGTYDVIRNTFVAIARNVGFHVGWEQLHALPSPMFNSYHQWVDIVFLKDKIRTLTYIVIVDPTRMDLLPQSCAI